MHIRFMHLADIHLGCEQYRLPQRTLDFWQSFQRAVADALREGVDFVIIAGDLFHQRNVSPTTLQQAEKELERLREAGIPAVGVMGNHERPLQNKQESWMDYLCGRGLLALLSPRYNADGELFMRPCQPPSQRGAYIDLGDVRVYGIPYYGAVLPRLVGDVAGYLGQQAQPAGFTIMVMHAGLPGVLPNFSANVTADDLAALRPYVQYLAMGHIHKPFESDGWVYNPGSLEPLTAAETAYRGGGYLVDVDTQREPAIHVEHRAYWKRPFHRLSLQATAYDTPDAFYAGARRYLAERAKKLSRRDGPAAEEKPMLDFTVQGVLQFPRDALEVGKLEEAARAAFDPLHVRVNVTATPADYEFAGDVGELSRPELERQIVADLIRGDGRFRDSVDAWADLVLEAKRMALEKADAEGIVEHLRAGRQRISSREQTQDANHAR